jgi:hypothetical protein
MDPTQGINKTVTMDDIPSTKQELLLGQFHQHYYAPLFANIFAPKN